MKPKQIILLSVILGILVLGILLKSWIRSVGDRSSSAQVSGALIAEFDTAKVDRILIAKGPSTPAVELARENGVWKIKSLWDAKADPVKVASFIQQLRSCRGELRGTGKNLFPDFGIQEADAFSIKLLDAGDKPLADLRLGKKRVGEEGYFIRKATSEDVFLVDLKMAELLGLFVDFEKATPSSEFWADLSLFNLDPEKVTKITLYHLKGEERTMALGLIRAADPRDPTKNIWKFLRKDMTLPLDSEKVLKFIAILMSVKAQKVVDPAGKDYGFEKPVWQLAITSGDKKILLNAGPKNAANDLYYVKNSVGSSVFALNAGYFDDLNSDDLHFVKEAAPAAPKPAP